MTENCSSDLDLPLGSLLLPSAAAKRRRICPQRNPPPPPPHPLNLNLNPFSKLGDDLLLEILIRLPNPRSSCRCKAVCKPWRSLISDPSFNRRFIPHHQSRYQPASLFLPSHDPQSIVSFLPVPDEARPELRVFDSFKDLLLCGFDVDYTGELGRSYFLCNPFTKQWIALPLAPPISEPALNRSAVLSYEPTTSSSSSNYNLGDAEPEPAFVYSEYRFRVVLLFQGCRELILQLFSFESGKWTQMHRYESLKMPSTAVIWWNGKLCWMNLDFRSSEANLLAYNPFRARRRPRAVPVPSALFDILCSARGNFSVSQGAFHIVLFEAEGLEHCSRNALSVWRMEEGGKYWSQQYDMVLNTTSSSSWGNYELDKFHVLDLHPEKSEIVFLRYCDDCFFSCNLKTGTGEPEFLSRVAQKCYAPRWRALQPTLSCWATPIPRYEDLRGMYDGSYHRWAQKSTTTTTLPSTTEECQSGHRRKNKRSAAASHLKPCGRRKQKVVEGGLCRKSGKRKLSSVIN